MFLFLVFTLVQMIFTASSEVWPKVKKFVSNFGTCPHKTFTQGLLCLPNQGGWEGQEEPYRVFSQLMGRDLQAGTLTMQDAAHLTGTSPFHNLLGLLLPHAALCNRLEQPAHRSKAMVGAFMAANGCCDSTKNSRFICFRDSILMILWLSYTHFSISGAQWTNSWFQNLKAGFFISSMNVIRRPQGWGLFTISRSKRTLKSKSKSI